MAEDQRGRSSFPAFLFDLTLEKSCLLHPRLSCRIARVQEAWQCEALHTDALDSCVAPPRGAAWAALTAGQGAGGGAAFFASHFQSGTGLSLPATIIALITKAK
jgi:hypothetical protein